VASLHTFAGEQLCVVRDISENGMRLRTFQPLNRGAAVVIALQPNDAFAGTVIWSCDGEIGIKLHSPLDVARALAWQGTKPQMSAPEAALPGSPNLRGLDALVRWFRDGMAEMESGSKLGVQAVTDWLLQRQAGAGRTPSAALPRRSAAACQAPVVGEAIRWA
jgi:hypothetical protein